MRPIVAPPWQVQHRAWECAFVLREEFWDELPIEHRVYVEVVCRTHPEGLGWLDLARMFIVYREHAHVRV